ncbi:MULTISPECIES: hypothetical protein [Pseudoalteromonas]|uniref:Lipoprotein n=1 Tax=Pseudoalteromonas prydzensis TaxID=182141 RepID=A0ABR9FSH1_9GAMM|nr:MULTISPECIES: hypothetical protein [Pseudoalteromonas]MBE0379388.1 hypothetical protein [Pseudoalteromonas prydzensis ACAM 620]MBE0459771.1 hypothetical protein [Pseudoalteromonas prydzensis]WKD24590.1 hypothetical protein NDQ71_05845 [Pseudoalteromonas sp. KG3]
MKKRLIKIASVSAMTLLLASCSPYASLNVSAPFKVGPVYVNPSIGMGGSL